MPDETLNELLMRVAMTYTGDTTSYPFNEAIRRAAQYYLDGGSGPSAFMLNQFFGDGYDGDVTVTGAVTLTRDMYYRNLTLSTGAAINTGLFRIFVSGTLDLSAAPTGAIYSNAASGNNAIVNAGGLAVSQSGGNGVFQGAGGVAGSAGGTAAGVTATAIAAGPYAGVAGSSGAAGAGASGAGGAAVTPVTPTVFSYRRAMIQDSVSTGVGRSGMAGQSASGGGGDGTAGGGGGSGAPSVPGIGIYAHTILRGASTAAGAIQNKGGNGGNGGTPAGGNRGGGGGAGGGGGGYVYILTTALTGAAKADAVDVSGGNGGNGGTGTGTGIGGAGGSSGGGGRLTVIDVTTGVVTETISAATPVAGTAAAGTVPGTGGVATVSQLSL